MPARRFDVLVHEETPDWESQHRQIDRRCVASVDELAAEGGSDPARARAAMQGMAVTVDRMLRRVLVVARRR